MLEIARRNAPIVGEAIGFENTEFVKGTIDDMTVNLEVVDEYLKEHPIQSSEGLYEYEAYVEKLRDENVLIADGSIDVIVSNCVLNLVDQNKKKCMFDEMFRVLKVGGRCVISDIVSDEDIPLEMQKDPDLWSGCISGAYQESDFIKAFEDAGFVGIETLKYDDDPWKVVGGIELRSVTVRAYKPSSESCYEGYQAVIYKGPFKSVEDDDNHVFERGARSAVCKKTFELLSKEGYREHFVLIEPNESANPLSTEKFDFSRKYRHPQETKGAKVKSQNNSSCCEPNASSCC